MTGRPDGQTEMGNPGGTGRQTEVETTQIGMETPMYAKTDVYGSDSFEGVISPDSFECVFRTDTGDGKFTMDTIGGVFCPQG